MTLRFTEPVDLVDGGYRLFGSDGLIGSLEAEASGDDVLLTPPTDLRDGSYVVAWRVISLDLHPISGALAFSVGEASGAPVAVPDTADITPVVSAVQGIAYAGLLAAVGLLLFRLVITGDVRVDRMPALLAAAVAVIGHVLLIPLTALRGAGRPIGDVFRVDAWNGGGDGLTVSVALMLGIAFAGALGATFARRARRRNRLVIMGVVVALLTLPLIGHTRTGDFSVALTGIDIIHGLAGATWFGGLIGLTRYLICEGRKNPVEGARIVSRFSVIAGVAFVVAAASGAFMAFRYLDGLDALVETTYGRILLVKLLTLLLPFGLAVWNRLWLVPAVERAPDAATAWGRLRWSVVGEALLLVVVIGLTGFLVLQDPDGVASGSGPATGAGSFEETMELEDGSLLIRITPGIVGQNDMVIEVRDASGEAVTLSEDPSVALSLPAEELGPLGATLAATDVPGEYAGPVMVPLEGEWEVSVTLRLSRFDQVTAKVTVTIPHTGE